MLSGVNSHFIALFGAITAENNSAILMTSASAVAEADRREGLEVCVEHSDCLLISITDAGGSPFSLQSEGDTK